MTNEPRGQRHPGQELVRRLALHHLAKCLAPDGERFEASDEDLSLLDLEGVDLAGAAFLRVTFDGSNLRRSGLSRASIAHSSMRDVDLSLADLHKARVESTVLAGAFLVHALLNGMDAHDVDFRGTDFSWSTARALHCDGCDLRNAVLRDMRLDYTTFRDCRMKGADLTGSSGTLARGSRIDVGDDGASEVLEGEALLAWFRDAGTTVTWSDPPWESDLRRQA